MGPIKKARDSVSNRARRESRAKAARAQAKAAQAQADLADAEAKVAQEQAAAIASALKEDETQRPCRARRGNSHRTPDGGVKPASAGGSGTLAMPERLAAGATFVTTAC
jgi:hypothetical protein